MTIPRWRLALAAGALVVLGVVGGGFAGAAATSPTPNVAADVDAAARSSSTPSRW